MTEERARLDTLHTTYPRVFSTGPLTWGFEHGDGWSDLIAALCANINEILESEPDASMQVKQAKEKFGTLRFYYRLNGVNDDVGMRVRRTVALAEKASGCICERCGCLATLRAEAGWWSTLCTSCRTDST
ncbi:hypothetical protein H0A65_15300 [Alcaligenaceae bacterium]|nr:hypothetical protein [Alcaligenaceae bacterium]